MADHASSPKPSREPHWDKFITPEGGFRLVQCEICRHLRSGTQTCDAFPEGIPDGIWDGEVDHRKQFPGDHGIRFEEAIIEEN